MNTATTCCVDHDQAVNCLAHLHDRTCKLLIHAAKGKAYKSLELAEIQVLPQLAKAFVQACGYEVKEEQTSPAGSSLRAKRILGDLHVRTGTMLTQVAMRQETGDIFGTFATREIYNIAREVVAAHGMQIR